MTLTIAIPSDIILTLKHVEIGGMLTVKVHGMVGIFTYRVLCVIIPWISLEASEIHMDRCIA